MLAGGASRRFGADKLAASIAGRTLLQHCLGGVPRDWEVVVVGPARPLDRPVVLVTEDPAGSGPAAAVLTGIRAATASVVVTTPGDAPAGGRAAVALVEALRAGTADACLATDADGVDQPLQLAVRGDALARARELPPDRAVDASARRLLLPLLDPVRVPLAPELTADVDVPADLP